MRRLDVHSVGLALIAAGLGVTGSCATATRSASDDRLLVDSEPPGASIFVQEHYVGQTPQLVDMPRDRSIRLRCSLPAYQDSITTVNRELAGAAAWDSPIFAAVDEISGAAWRLQRKSLFVQLIPLGAPASDGGARPLP